VVGLVSQVLAQAGLTPESAAAVATLDRRAGDAALRAVGRVLGRPVHGFPAAALAGVPVPNPSPVAAGAVGTPSVAEAAALLGAGPGAALVVPKRRGPSATVAVARRAGPPGRVAVVGLGPGGAAHRTPAAGAAVRAAEVVIGYGPYVDQASDLLGPGQEVVRSPIEARLHAVGRADLAVTIYNPRSRGRPWQLGAARDVLLSHRPRSTPVGVVTDAGRDGQRVFLTTLARLDPDDVGMTTCVVVG